MAVEKFDHVASLMASLVISLIPLVIFAFMPETLGMRTNHHQQEPNASIEESPYKPLALTADSSYGSTDESSYDTSPLTKLL